MERKTIRKWFWVWDFVKEENWINEMAMQGWVLDGVGFCTYHFIACEPGEYSVKLELRDCDEDYEQLLKESGVEVVGRYLKWFYYRKKTELGAFELFSDIDSRIAHLDRIAKMLVLIGAANILIGVGSGSSINLLCAVLLMYACGRVHGIKQVMEMNREMHE